jgi:hypothetical protein
MLAGHTTLCDLHHQAATNLAAQGFEITNRLGDRPEKHLARTNILTGEIHRQPYVRLHPIEGPQSKYERVLGDGDIESGIFV